MRRGSFGHGEGEPGDDGSFCHVLPCLLIIGMFIHVDDIFEGQFCGMLCQCVADRLVVDAPVSLDGMAKHVKSGAGGGVWRNGVGELRVYNRYRGVETVRVHGRLDAAPVVGKHRYAGYLTARTGSSGYGDEWQVLFG